MNKAINRITSPEKHLQYIRNWKTPYGIFRKSTNAISALPHPVGFTTFKQWCNFPDKMITTIMYRRYPELFTGCLTYGEAGFGRVG